MDPAARREERLGDLVRMGLAAALFLLTMLAVQRGHLSALERDVFRLVNDLPAGLTVPLWLVMQLGSRLAPLVLGAVAIAFRRVRLGVSVLVAGTAAWGVAQVLKVLVERPRPADFLHDLPIEWSSGGPGFVSGHTAVATAMAAVAAPHLPRRWRRVVWALALAVGVARVYSGVHLPLDVVGGFAVGWFVGTGVHLLIGVPMPQRTPDVVAGMLRGLGLDVVAVEPAHVHARVSHPFVVTTAAGERLFAKVLDPDPRAGDWLLRLSRYVASRERREVTALSSLPARAEHEAAVTMAARNAGVRVPAVVLARGYGSAAVVVVGLVPGTDLHEAPADGPDDDTLRRVWREVAHLRAARIAHRDLVRRNVVLDESGAVWVVDFHDGEVGAGDAALDGDVAELLASLTSVADAERVVAAAVQELGPEAVGRALPALQPYALSPSTRREVRDSPGLLRAVREAVGGGPEVVVQPLAPRRLVVPGLVSVAGYAVLVTVAGWAEVAQALADVYVRWVGVAAAVFLVWPLALGFALVLAGRRRVAVGRSALAVAVASTSDVLGGAPSRRRHLIRYLRSCGAGGDEPAHAVDLVLAGERVAGALMLVGALVVGFGTGSLRLEVAEATPWFALIAVLAAAGAWLWRRRRQDGASGVPRGWLAGTWRRSRRAPARPAAVLVTMTAAELALVLSLSAGLRAFGPGTTVAVAALALAVPRVLLRALGLTSAPLVGEATATAALCLLGVPPATAVLAVLTYALLRYWAMGLVAVVAGPRFAPVHVPAGDAGGCRHGEVGVRDRAAHRARDQADPRPVGGGRLGARAGRPRP